MSEQLTIRMTNDRDEVLEAIMNEGLCPVECSIGGESIVDALQMDHHGERSNLESVAVRAYRDHFGARRSDPRFVGVGAPDADMTFAIAALAGVLPHPSVPGFGGRPGTDLSALAETIALLDTDPIGRDVTAMPSGDIVLAWKTMMAAMGDDDLAAITGVGLWRLLTSGHPAIKPMVAGARVSAQEARVRALKDLEGAEPAKGKVLALKSTIFGFEVWYGRLPDQGAPDEISGWTNPVVFALTSQGNITVGCPNKAVAEAIFGEGGLLRLFNTQPFTGWGGREAVGGSPRGAIMTHDQLIMAADLARSFIRGATLSDEPLI